MFKEQIKTFVRMERRYSSDYSRDGDRKTNVYLYGFQKNGRITGYMWKQETHAAANDDDTVFAQGIADARGEDVEFGVCCNVPDRDEKGAYICGDKERFPEGLTVEYDGQGRIFFCGMTENGVRNGLGTEFYYSGSGRVLRLRGLWENGELSYVLSWDHVKSRLDLISINEQDSAQNDADTAGLLEELALFAPEKRAKELEALAAKFRSLVKNGKEQKE